jgi:hypothetical protein
MERRKFVVGLGALATGSAAATGTGALTSTQADRTVNVNVANDGNAYLGLAAPDSLKNGEYAKDASEGSSQLTLNFNGDASISGSGTGINEDAVSEFDQVFQILNQGDDFMRLGIDKSGLANPGRWQFSPTSSYNPDSYPNWDTEGTTGPGISTGDSLDISVQIDTTGIDELAGGELTFVAVDPDD